MITEDLFTRRPPVPKQAEIGLNRAQTVDTEAAGRGAEIVFRSVHANSKSAYRQERAEGHLSKREQMILNDLIAHGSGTDREIARRLGFAHLSAVQPRISDLIKAGKLIEVGSEVCAETHKRVRRIGVA